jgi:hypothetical protein
MLTAGRPGFTHLIAVSRAMKCPDMLPIPDVIAEAGEQKWVRAMGVRAAGHAVRRRWHCNLAGLARLATSAGAPASGVRRGEERESLRESATGIILFFYSSSSSSSSTTRLTTLNSSQPQSTYTTITTYTTIRI